MDMVFTKPSDAIASPKATTAELAKLTHASTETILRYKRMGNDGPFRENRDFIYLGLGRRKILWDISVAHQSLWSFKRGESSSEVETFSRDTTPLSF